MAEESFGRRLRSERERRHIALSSISANTKISVSLFEGLERDDVSRWPSGIFRRAFIRSYADAIGLDAHRITKEFLERFPDLSDPPPAPAEAQPPTPPPRDPRAWIVVTVRLPRWVHSCSSWVYSCASFVSRVASRPTIERAHTADK